MLKPCSFHLSPWVQPPPTPPFLSSDLVLTGGGEHQQRGVQGASNTTPSSGGVSGPGGWEKQGNWGMIKSIALLYCGLQIQGSEFII